MGVDPSNQLAFSFINGSQTSGFHSTTSPTLRREAVPPRSTRKTTGQHQIGRTETQSWTGRHEDEGANNLTETAYLDDRKSEVLDSRRTLELCSFSEGRAVPDAVRISPVALLV